MKPTERRETGQRDMFRSRLDQIIDMRHPLVRLSGKIDRGFLDDRFGEVHEDKPGRPPLATRPMAGLAILKHMHDLSDENLCDHRVENPYFQYFCGEEFFQHKPPFDRSSLTRWRHRVKVSVATPVHRCKGGQFVAHVAALPGNPYDGHTLAKVIPAAEAQIGASLSRIVADAGYRGHNAPEGYKLKVYTSGLKRGVTQTIKRELKRRSAVGYNFRLLIRWLALLCAKILPALAAPRTPTYRSIVA